MGGRKSKLAVEEREDALEGMGEHVFCNGLILGKITDYLSYTDCKMLRLVSGSLNGAMVRETNFPSRTKLLIRIEEMNEVMLEGMDFSIKHAEIMMENSVDLEGKDKVLADVLYGLESLTVVCVCEDGYFPFESVSEVILGTRKLKKLALREIHRGSYDSRNGCDYWDSRLCGPLKSVTDLSYFNARNPLDFKISSSFDELKRIEFKYDSLAWSKGCNCPYLAQTVLLNCGTLEKLQVQGVMARGTQQFLRTEVLAANFPMLQEVDLTNGNELNCFDSNMLKLFKKHGAQLKKVRISIEGLLDGVGEVAGYLNPNKLVSLTLLLGEGVLPEGASSHEYLRCWRDFNNLLEFGLHFPYVESEGEESLWGVSGFPPLPRDLVKLNFEYSNASGTILPHEYLDAYAKLTHLRIQATRLTDVGVESICRTCTRLTELVIMGYKYGDSGLTGCNSGSVGAGQCNEATISNLKNLRILVIHGYGITNLTIQHIRIQGLQHLGISSKYITEAGFHAAALQNPSLESLYVFPLQIRKINGILKRQEFPRLKYCMAKKDGFIGTYQLQPGRPEFHKIYRLPASVYDDIYYRG